MYNLGHGLGYQFNHSPRKERNSSLFPKDKKVQMSFRNGLNNNASREPPIQRLLYPNGITFDDSTQFPIIISPSKQKTSISNLDTALTSNFSVVDIPHIVDAICHHLNLKDIWNCCLVDRSWHNAFFSYRYKNVKFDNISSKKSWGILEYTQFIWSLTIDPFDGEYFFQKPITFQSSHQDSPSDRCTNLRVLRCIQLRYLCACGHFNEIICSDCKPPKLDTSINLISSNPLLERIELMFLWRTLNDDALPLHLTNSILKTFSELRFLRYLKISSLYEPLDMRQLLIHLPQSLELFHIRSTTTIPNDNDNDDVPIVATNIKSLSIFDFNAWYARSLWRQSPMLEEIGFDLDFVEFPTWSEVLIANCPKVHTFHFNCWMYDDGITNLFNVYEGIQRLKLYKETIPNISELITSRHVNSLRCLYLISERLGSPTGNILRVCPNLQELSLSAKSCIFLFQLLWENEEDLSLRSSEYRYIPWACRNLELFECVINDEVYSSEGSEIDLDIIRQIRMLHHELRSLSQLHSLSLRWTLDQVGKRSMMQEFRDQLVSDDGQPDQFKMTNDDFNWMKIKFIVGGRFNDDIFMVE